MPTFTEAQLEDAIIQLLGEQGIAHVVGGDIDRGSRGNEEVLIKADLRAFLASQYADESITASEIETIIRELEAYSSLDLYESNKQIMKRLADGFQLKREPVAGQDPKDLYIYLMDYAASDNNHYKVVNQLTIQGPEEKRIPDAILYINGLPLVVFEFKSAIRIEANCFEAYEQLTNRYRRDIPELFKYNAFCVVSDGPNTKSGSFFAKYDFYYAWRKVTGDETVERQGLESINTMIAGLFDRDRLRDVIRNFISPLQG